MSRKKTKSGKKKLKSKKNRRDLKSRSSARRLGNNTNSVLYSALAQAEQYYKSNQETRILEALTAVELNALKENTPQRFRFLTLKAIGHAFSGELVEAEQFCRQGLSEFPDALDFYYILTYLNLSMREFSQAIWNGEKYLQLLRVKPILEKMPHPLCGMLAHLSQLQNMVGNANRELDKTEQAILHYEAAILADAGNQLPYLNLATLYSHQGNIEGAQKSIARGLEKCVQVQELRMLEQTFKNKRSISACMIVKDEEKLLSGCLDSIRDWVDEIIIVDTGSNDKTVSIALTYGAKVFNQTWEGNFSRHRNFTIEKATSDWVFIIDADERMCQEDIPRLKELVNSDQHSLISINVFNVYGKDEKMTTFLPSVRLFRRDLNLRYEGIVHNRLVLPDNASIVRANVKLKHLGYDLSPEQMRKKFERSHALWEKQLQKNPNDAFALFNLAQLLRGAGKDKPDLFSDQIIRHATKAVTLTNPNDLEMRNIHLMSLDQLAWAHFYRGNHKQALSFAETALRFKSNYLDPLLLLGHIYTQTKEFDKANTAYQKYLEIQAKYDPTSEKDNIILVNPDSRAVAYYGLGLLGELTNDLKEASAFYHKTMDINPEHLDVKQRIAALERQRSVSSSALSTGSKYLEEGKFDEAEGEFKKAVSESREKRHVIKEIAHNYMAVLHYEDAIRYYQIWLDTKNDDADILNDMANCYFKMKQFEQALEYYKKASRIPEAPNIVFRNIGLTCANLKQYGPAIIAFRKYFETNQEDPEVNSIMADLCIKVGDFKTAMPLYEKTLRTNPRDYQAIFNLSECYLNMGHEDSARIGYNRVLELKPDYEPAQKRLTQLQEISTA